MTALNANRLADYADALEFFGNSLLVPMDQMEDVGLESGFWRDFPRFDSAAVGQAARVCAEYVEQLSRDCASTADEAAVVSEEFDELFGGILQPLVAPWESLYRVEEGAEAPEVGAGAAAQEMSAELERVGVELAPGNGQFADHMGLELLCASKLVKGLSEAYGSSDAKALSAQLDSLLAFLENHPIAWIGSLRSTVVSVKPQGYFAALLGMVLAVLETLRAELAAAVESLKNPLESAKAMLRRQVKNLRHALMDDSREQTDAALAANVIGLPEFGAADALFTFVSMGDEVDTHALIETAWAQGKRVYAPRCVGARQMEWHLIESFEGLETSSFGVDEPPADEATLVDPAAVENAIALVPGLMFDVWGYRIGYGGGFYDAFLETFEGVTVGICAAPFISTVHLPCEPHDLPVQMVVTNLDVIRPEGEPPEY